MGIGAAELDILCRGPSQAAFIGCRAVSWIARCIDLVTGIAHSGLSRQAVEEGLVTDQRDVQFAKGFINVIAPIDLRRGTASATKFAGRLCQSVRSLMCTIFAILTTNREIHWVGGRRAREPCFPRDDTPNLHKRGADASRAICGNVRNLRRSNAVSSPEDIHGNAARASSRSSPTRGTNKARCSVRRKYAGAQTRSQNIVFQGLDVFRFAISCRHIIMDRTGNIPADACLIVEDRRLEIAEPWADFDSTTVQRHIDRPEIWTCRTQRYRRSITLCLREPRRVYHLAGH